MYIEWNDPRFTLKMVREALCFAQSQMPFSASGNHAVFTMQTLINAIDKQRPLGPDGVHGDRHTIGCGCIDKG